MTRRRSLILGGLFFALMFVFSGVNAYNSPAFWKSDPGWAVSQQGGVVRIVYVRPGGPAPALQAGDEIVSLDGQPVKQALQLAAFTRLAAGTPYSIVIRRQGQTQGFTFRTAPLPVPVSMLFRVMYLVIPALVLITGLAVFLLKPDDKQALLLALMFGMFIPEIPGAAFAGSSLWLIGLMVCGSTVSNFVWPVFLHFFLIFPERSPLLRRFPRVEVYLYLPYLLLFLPFYTTNYVLSAVAPERAFAFQQKFVRLEVVISSLIVAYIAGGLVSLLVNYRQASRTSRRKMRVVVAGSIVGFLPSLLMAGAYFIGGPASFSTVQWEWLGVISVVAFTVFPLSFAYAIVRHQVIPIRLIIRRGVRYVFVSQGSVVLELVAVFLALIFLLNNVFTYLQASGLVIVIVSGVVSVVVWNSTRSLHCRVIAPVIDRRFFRRSYNAQQILSELGQELRGMTEMREMTPLVSTKIQDALQTENVAIFLRDERSGDYLCATSSEHVEDGPVAVGAKQGLVLPRHAFVAERLRESLQPLAVDFDDPNSWMRALASADAAGNLSRWGEGKVLRSVRSTLLLPVATKDQLLGIVSLGPRLGDLPFSRENKQLLMTVVWQMALVIENAQLVRRKAEEERLRTELEFATEVQRRLFPERPPTLASLELSGVCHPARGVGGDYYDFLVLGPGQVGIAVADVAGKGISAALLMSTVQASLRSQAATVDGRLTELVASMNRLLYGSTDTSSYATFFYAQFDEHSRCLTYVNAGHNPPLLVRPMDEARSHRNDSRGAADGQAVAASPEVDLAATSVARLMTGGPVIGLLENCVYEHETLEVQSGDVLVAYTDGVSEALNPEGEEFGEDRLAGVVTEWSHLSAEELSERIVETVQDWCRDAPQHDDMTLVVVKVK